MAAGAVVIKDLCPALTTFSTPFNRFAPFGYRKFVAVGNRATAIKLKDGRIILLNPIQLDPAIRNKLDQLGGVHFLACDLGHHMYVKSYQNVWPEAKTIGVRGLDNKRKDVSWSYIYNDWQSSPEDQYGFADEIETVLFEGFITYAVAWYHKPSKTLIQTDLMMNLPATEQYNPSSAEQDLFSREFAKRAHPRSIWFRRLIYYVACVEFNLMHRDTNRVAQWDLQRIIPCHGDVIQDGGNDAWRETYQWFLDMTEKPSLLWAAKEPIMKMARRLFLL